MVSFQLVHTFTDLIFQGDHILRSWRLGRQGVNVGAGTIRLAIAGQTAPRDEVSSPTWAQ